ncbi:MAG: glutaminyl-peptide cyclotransferase [Deltaproteobacteria bacterium]|nr:glutaminyl-peptide cyclotransferase [Deltaproteobacteria bacterium]
MIRKRLFQHAAIAGILAAFLITALIGLLPGLVRAEAGPPSAGRKQVELPVYGYRVVNVYPHDRQAYTQGLIWCDGFLYEGTGLNGASSLRKVRLETGRVVEQHSLDRQYFGEGITEWGGRLLQLTWNSNLGFIYDRSGLKVRGTFRYKGEGWGLTHDRDRLIMSDGTATLRFFDPKTLRETGRLNVQSGGAPLTDLNELEFVRGEIFANVYRTDLIARISPQTGAVTGWIDLRGLLPEADRRIPVDVLNGIAYDAGGNRLFVTGKLWPKLFEIELFRRE